MALFSSCDRPGCWRSGAQCAAALARALKASTLCGGTTAPRLSATCVASHCATPAACSQSALNRGRRGRHANRCCNRCGNGWRPSERYHATTLNQPTFCLRAPGQYCPPAAPVRTAAAPSHARTAARSPLPAPLPQPPGWLPPNVQPCTPAAAVGTHGLQGRRPLQLTADWPRPLPRAVSQGPA